jgi:NADPH:quinone reductase-like Zn-dependent oxidoreductase
MRAAVQEAYGPPEVLRLRDVPRPNPTGKDVLVKIQAASVNAMDAHFLHFPLLARVFFGLRKPKRPIRGVDLAGVVAAVGPDVQGFQPGDPVFGTGSGSFAEYAITAQDRLVSMRTELSFAQAATLPVAGLTALQGLRDKAGLRPGHRVLIHGAGGGVGTFAVQIAKALGGHVTAVTGRRNLDLVRSLGPDEVIDYSRDDFARRDARYDILFDVAATRPLGDCLRVLTPRGTLMRIGAPKNGWPSILTGLLATLLRRPFTSRRMPLFIAKSSPTDLAFLQDLVAEGKITPAIDRHYPLDEIVEALRYVHSGQARAKVIIDL